MPTSRRTPSLCSHIYLWCSYILDWRVSLQASVRTVKNRFSEFLRRAHRGEEIIVTSHNRPVAKLVPLAPGESATDTSRRALLADLEELRASISDRSPGTPLSQTVIDLRTDERY